MVVVQYIVISMEEIPDQVLNFKPAAGGFSGIGKGPV
jgi:hypothetical protein